MMRILVGTEKGAYLLTESGSEWQVEGPMFPGWKVTAFGQTSRGAYLAATGSNWFGIGVHHSENLLDWKPSDSPPAWPEGSDRKMEQIWTFHNEGDRLLAGVAQAGLFSSDDRGHELGPRDEPQRASHPGPVVSRGRWSLCSSHPLRQRKHVGRDLSRRCLQIGRRWGSPGCPRTTGFPRLTPQRAGSALRWATACMVWPMIRPSRAACGARTIRGCFVPPTAATTGNGSRTGYRLGFGFVMWRHPDTRRLLTVPLESSENRVPVDGAAQRIRLGRRRFHVAGRRQWLVGRPSVHRCAATGFRRRRQWWILLWDFGREVVAHP